MNELFYRELKPQGWLKQQLRIQAEGLSGNLDKMWPDVRDSAWIGGDREGWERVPYWLDGFIPLAYLLEDEDLLARADKYVQGIVDRQQEDGWICPCTVEARATYDPWAILLIGKVLAQYCEFKDDQRVETALYRTMRNLYDLMQDGTVKLFSWGEFRWFEGIIPLLHLYARQPEEWMLALAKLLREQGADWPSYQEDWKRWLSRIRHWTHIVNIGMMLKYEAVISTLLGEEYTNVPEQLWQVLEQHNGTAVGTFTGDEHLGGVNNNRGTELCAVVEQMYSCEWLYRITGDNVWAERLEKMAFNAMPATFTDDMWAHQYDQMVNQIACIPFPRKPFFGTNNHEAHLFGLEPNFGCCTANMHQGWPKLALHALQKTDKGALVAHLLPVKVETQLGGKPVTIRVDSEYPFRLRAAITVEAAEKTAFELKIRVPAWAKNVQLDGKRAQVRNHLITLNRSWQGSVTFELTMASAPKLVSRPTGLKALEYGPLVFALPIETEYVMKEYERNNVERKFPYCDYELHPKSAWNYGFAENAFAVEERPIDAIPFSSKNPPLVIHAKLAPVDWPMAEGYEHVSDVRPASNKAIGSAEDKVLVPYGCAKLRMTEMPKVR